ncbi:MAG TPA: MBL fold metallo-hydrolase [Planctomycetota bacterium]
MIVERSLHTGWLSNTWLVADHAGGHGVVIDTGGPREPIEARIAELRITVTHVLCTHHHIDHVLHNREYAAQHGCPVCGHAAERELFGHLDLELAADQEIDSGTLRVRALHVPGHTKGQLAFLVNEERLFTGDTLFKGSVGGTRAPGHASFDELRHSILEVLLALPPATIVHPGHTETTTVADELRENPFVNAWRKPETVQPRPCTAYGQPATLLLEARDYDGGTKCWVRWDDGSQDVVPGSRVGPA